MRKMILLLAALCCMALSLNSFAAEAAKNAAAQDQAPILKSYTGNLSDNKTQISYVTMIGLFGPLAGLAALDVAEAVKFTVPKAGWTLRGLTILGWDGFNGTMASIPRGQLFALEVRDKDKKLLYQFADLQIPYTNYVFNQTSASPIDIELPPIAVTDEFYVCVYERGTFFVGAEITNKTGNSYFYSKASGNMTQAQLPIANNMTSPVNWIMEAIGS